MKTPHGFFFNMLRFLGCGGKRNAIYSSHNVSWGGGLQSSSLIHSLGHDTEYLNVMFIKLHCLKI